MKYINYMRAKLIYEKFEKDSDPVRDMEIGGILLRPQFDKLYKEFKEKWKDYLATTIGDINGKKVSGKFRKGSKSEPYGNYTFIVEQSFFNFNDGDYLMKDGDNINMNGGIILISTEDNYYYNDGGEIFYIDES